MVVADYRVGFFFPFFRRPLVMICKRTRIFMAASFRSTIRGHASLRKKARIWHSRSSQTVGYYLFNSLVPLWAFRRARASPRYQNWKRAKK